MPSKPLTYQRTQTWEKPTKLKMYRCSVHFLMTIVILTLLPYTSLSLPNGDPAPGRSPGPPVATLDLKAEDIKAILSVDYESTTEVEVTSVDIEDTCAFAKVPSESGDIVTLSAEDSEVNVTVTHPVFDSEELVRGVVYDVHLQFESSDLRDYVLHTTVDGFVRGNFTPTSPLERPCHEEPYFLPRPKHTHYEFRTKSDYQEAYNSDVQNDMYQSEQNGYQVGLRNVYQSDTQSGHSDYQSGHSDYQSGHSDYQTGHSDYQGVNSVYDENVYFRPRRERSLRVGKSVRFRRRFLPARVLAGPLEDRSSVVLQWSIDAVRLDKKDTTVVFRLRYRKTMSATIYQVFFTKILRLECAIHIKSSRNIRVHSGHMPRARSCRLLLPPPPPRRAILTELHKLNVPCTSGFLRFTPTSPILCGKLEQLPAQNRKHIYATTKNSVELHGRPTFAAVFRQVDHCHDVLLTARNGSFEVGPTTKLLCSYKIHLPFGNRVALRLQMGTGSMTDKENDLSNIIHEDSQALCRGMELSLQNGESMWRHCSQPGDPLRNVQIVSEGNFVRLNISVFAKKSTSAMWLKVWWMDKPIEDIMGHCDYGWVLSGDFCISVAREVKKAWRQAETECAGRGGHLASVLTDRQQQIMDQLLINSPGAGVDDVYWIGATDAVHEGEFRWSDGLPFSYAHWFPGYRKHSSQPNDDGTSGQDCVEARREFPPRPAPASPTFMWNDRGCREHNYFVCERPSVEDPYIASKIQCNETIQLSRSHPHATVSSAGFPRPYPDDVECVSELRAPPHHTLTLHFEELMTELEPHCTYDFLEIIEIGDGNSSEHDPWSQEHHDAYASDNEVWEETETLIPESDSVSAGWARELQDTRARRLCGDWGGKLKLLRYQSKTNVLRLRFKSDHSRHFAGYRAKVTVADSLSCMDTKQVLFNGHCYLFSGYPRASWATAKQVCEGLSMHLSSVHSAEEERFIVSGIRQSSDYSAGSVYWLGAHFAKTNERTAEEFSWIDGSAVVYQGWPPYNDTEDVIDACLGVQWKSSPVPSQPSGLYWTLHKCTITGGYVCKRRLNHENVFRNRTVEGSSGIFTSPNYPGNYDNDIDYWVHIVGPSSTRLVFIFQTVDLEYQKDCLYDFVELRDVRSMKSSRYCGSVGETRWVASSNKAILHFHSDYNIQGSGFSVSWRAVELTGCPAQTLTSKEGILRSPNFPQFLLPNLDCTIDILAPTGKRVFLNISYYDFGYGVFEKGVPINVTESIPEDSFLEVQVDPKSVPIRPFINPNILTNGLFVSQSEILRLRLKTGENVTGNGFLAHFKTISFLNVSHVVELGDVRSGRVAAPNWPQRAPTRASIRVHLLAPHHHTLTLAVLRATLVQRSGDWPCGDGEGWIEVKDSYSDNNGTQWTLCEVDRSKRKLEPIAPLIINSYLHSLMVTQHSGERGVNMDVSLIVNKDPEYHSKVLLLSEETSLESCYPNPCLHDGRCANEGSKKYCQCAGYYTGIFCLVTACERSPCAFGNCTVMPRTAPSTGPSSDEGFLCVCARGYRGKRCAERIRPCASRPCNARGACLETAGGFLCQCNPSWTGKRCELPNPSPNIIGLGQRMIQEPFWLGLLAVFVVLGSIGLVWCAKRHFPEKIEKLLAEEADRCTRRTPSPRKKRNNSTPTKKNAAEKKQILQQLISPAATNDHSKKLTMGELIQMSEKRTLSTVESAPAFVNYGIENKETSFASEASSPSTSPSMRHISDPKLEKKVTFARLLNKVSAEMSSSSEVEMVNTIAIPMAVMADRGFRTKSSSTPPSPGVEMRSPHSTSSNQGSDSMSSLDLTLANAALKKYSRTPKISSADSILAMFRNFSSSSAVMVSRASSGGVSISSTPSASSPQDDTVDGDDISLASSQFPSLAPDSPVTRPHNTIEVQVFDPLSGHKSSSSGNSLLHPPSILLEVPSGINKCLSPIRELPTPLPTPMPTPLPSPRLPRAKPLDQDPEESAVISISPSDDELDEIKFETKNERPSGLKLKLRQTATVSTDTPTPSTQVTDSPSPSFTHSQDSEREMSSPSPAPPSLRVPVLTIERPSPGSPPPRRTPPHLEFQPPPLITVTYNETEESDEPMSPRPPPPSGNMCYLSPFSMSARGERAPSESNLSSSGYSSMASPGPSRCGSSNPLCPSEMEDPGSGGGPSCFQRRRPLMKTNSGPATSNGDSKERRRGRSDSETLSDDPLLESNDEGIGTDERVDDVPTSAKEMEISLKETLEIPVLVSPSGVTKCSIVKCVSVERGLDEKASLRPPTLIAEGSQLSPVSSRSESPLSDKTGLGRFSPQFYGRQLPFTDSDGLYDFPSSECVKGNSFKIGSNITKKSGRKRDRRTARTTSHEPAGTTKSTLPHMPHSMHNLLEVPGPRDASGRGRKGGRRRSRSQAPAPASSSSSEDSVSNASVASVASARELRLPDLDMQQSEPLRLRKPLRRQKCRSSEDTSSKISSSLDLTEDSRKPPKVNKLRTISNQIRFLRRLERSLKMKESYPAISDDEGDESSSVTSPLLQGRKDLSRLPSHATSAPLLSSIRPKITRQRRYDRNLVSEETRTLNTAAGQDNSD